MGAMAIAPAAGSGEPPALLGGGKPLSVREVADRLGVSTKLVYQLCAARQMGHIRVGNSVRVTPDQLAEYVRRCSRGPQPPAAA